MDLIYQVLLGCLGLIATVGIILYYRFLVSPFRLLSSHGIKTSSPIPILGNYLDAIRHGEQQSLDILAEKYGDVFGYYLGRVPKVVVLDPEVLKVVTVKEFDNFQNHGFVGPTSLLPKALGIQPGLSASDIKEWRPCCRAISPAFSSMKIKLMVPLIKNSTDVLLEILGECAKNNKSAEVFKLYALYTLEVHIATTFGQHVAIQRGETHKLATAVQSLFKCAKEGSVLSFSVFTIIYSNFPWLEPLLLQGVRGSEAGKAIKLIYTTAQRLIEARMKAEKPPQVKDLLQLMIEATVDEDDDEQPSGKRLTSAQIAGLSMDFFLAGYESIAGSLGFTSYLLAMHPNIQEKLQTDIERYFDENPDCSLYEAAQEITYLDMVLYESLRVFSPLPKRCHIPIRMINRNAKYWPEPDKFDPERFAPEIKASRLPLAYMSFGAGPHNCLGQRFALLTAKITLIEFLKKFSFVRGPETVAKLRTKVGITQTPLDQVLIKIVPRN